MSPSPPFHPLVVHLPLALSLLVPLLAAGALLAWWKGWLPGRRTWAVVLVLQALLTAGAFAALRTGQAEEERVERVVPASALEAHEEAAKLLVGTAAAALVLTALALFVPGEGLPRRIAVAALAGMLATAVLAVRAGKAGGALVYQHGAASVYATATTMLPASEADSD